MIGWRVPCVITGPRTGRSPGVVAKDTQGSGVGGGGHRVVYVIVGVVTGRLEAEAGHLTVR